MDTLISLLGRALQWEVINRQEFAISRNSNREHDGNITRAIQDTNDSHRTDRSVVNDQIAADRPKEQWLIRKIFSAVTYARVLSQPL